MSSLAPSQWGCPFSSCGRHPVTVPGCWQPTSCPTFQDLRESFEAIREQEVGRIRHRLNEADREEIDILTKRIVNKLLHAPMSNMRNGHGQDHEDTHRKISLLRHIFGLDKHH